MDEIERYLASLKVKAIIYDDEINSDFDYEECRNYILSDEFLDNLALRVSVNELTKTIDKQIKKNIFEVLFFIRENKTENRKETIDKINNIIVSLNVTAEDCCALFYKNEFAKRENLTPDEYHKIPLEIVKEDKNLREMLNYSLMLDYDTVNCLLSDDEEIFKDEVVEKELLNDYFISTINAVLKDCPTLLNNEQFRRRTIYVLELLMKKNDLNEQETIDRAQKIYKIMKKR